VQDQPRPRLRHRHEDRAVHRAPPLARPRAGDGRGGAALEGPAEGRPRDPPHLGVEVGVVGDLLVAQAVGGEARRDRRRVAAVDHVAGARRGERQRRHQVVAQRQVPDLGLGLVVLGPGAARHLRRHALVAVAAEVDRARRRGITARHQHDALAGHAAIGGVGRGLDVAPVAAVGRRLGEHRLEDVAGGRDPLGVGPPRVGLDQDAQPVAGRRVGLREARRRVAVGEPRARIVVDVERRIERQRQVAGGGHALDQRTLQRAAGGLEVVAAAGLGRHHHRDVVLELGAVGGVQIDEQRRIPAPPQPEQRRHLGRVHLDEVAIEVEPGGVGAEAHLLGAALVGAVVGAEALVAVDVEDRHEHHGGGVEQLGQRRAGDQIAREPEAGVLALDLAGVDAGLDQQHRPPGARVGGRVEAVARQHQRHQLAAGRRRAEGLAASGGRVGDREVVAQPHRLGVAAGGEPARALAGRGQVARDRRVVGAGGGEDGEAQPAAHRSCLTQIARARHCRTGVAPVAGALHPGAKVTRSACR
jgi:hypothetical protein